MKRPVARDRVLSYDDVILPEGRLCDRLRRDQDERFGRAGAPLAAADSGGAPDAVRQ